MAWYGRQPYPQTLGEMQRLRDCMIAAPERSGCLILCEHPPTITCGKHSKPENVLLSSAELESRGIAVEPVDRGGDVTYHGPGQLMIYPVVRVGIRVSAFLECIADALSLLALEFGVTGARWQSDEAGLWLEHRKLAACGLNLRRGVSIHGYSFNVRTPPGDWRCIVPCGLAGPGPISLLEALGGEDGPSIEECARAALPLLHRALAPYGLDPNARAELG